MINYFTSYSPFPTDRTEQVSPYSIAISTENVLTRYIFYFHHFRPFQLIYAIYTVANQPLSFRILLVGRKFHSNSLSPRPRTVTLWKWIPRICFPEHIVLIFFKVCFTDHYNAISDSRGNRYVLSKNSFYNSLHWVVLGYSKKKKMKRPPAKLVYII